MRTFLKILLLVNIGLIFGLWYSRSRARLNSGIQKALTEQTFDDPGSVARHEDAFQPVPRSIPRPCRRPLPAALAGSGLAYLPESMAQPYLTKGRLKRVLQEWCLPYSGYHLFYPSRRQPSAAFALVVEALRHRGK